MHWGLIPHWAADPTIGNRMIIFEGNNKEVRVRGREITLSYRMPTKGNSRKTIVSCIHDLTGQGQIYAKCCSLPNLSRFLDLAAVVLDDPVTNRKAQSQTAFLFGSEKRLEKLRQVIIFDTKTGIRYANGYFFTHVLRLYRQYSSI